MNGNEWEKDRHGVIDVAAVDDHPVVLGGMDGWLGPAGSGIRLVDTATTVAELLSGPGRDAHVVLLDLDLGDGSPVERNVRALRDAGAAVLVLSASSKPVSVRAALRAGAGGYVLKTDDAEEIRAAVRAVAAGEVRLSARLASVLLTDRSPDRPALSAQERRALQLYAAGLPMKSVARRMGVSEETAKQYIKRVREKYDRTGRDAHTKPGLYRRAVEDGHLPPP